MFWLRAVAALAVCGLAGAANAACPAVNLYPFKAGCHLDADPLNSAIRSGPQTHLTSDKFRNITTTDPFWTGQSNQPSVFATDTSNGFVGGVGLAAFSLNNSPPSTNKQPVALLGVGQLGTAALPGASPGNLEFGGNFQCKTYDVGVCIGAEIDSENHFGAPQSALPLSLGFGQTVPAPVGLTIAAEGEFDSSLALNIGSHDDSVRWLTGIYLRAKRVVDTGLYIDAASTGGLPAVSALIRNTGNDISTARNLVLQTMGTGADAGKVLEVADAAGASKYSIRQNGDVFTAAGTAHYAGFASINIKATPTEDSPHISTQQTTSPALTSCGGVPAITGSDIAGTVTMGGSATGCVITFDRAYSVAPHCVVTWRDTPLASQSYDISTVAITLTQTATSGNKVDYICFAEG